MDVNGDTNALLYLSRTDVAGLLPPLDEQIALADRTFTMLAAGGAVSPPKPSIRPRPDGFIHAMPAYVRESDVACVKWIAGYRRNKFAGLPYLNGLIIMSDAETGIPTAVLDAAEVTAARTAAASAVCVLRFAPPDWSGAAILGCGEQGQYHGTILRHLNPHVVLRAFDPHPERVAALGEDIYRASNARDAVDGADIVVTAGPIHEKPAPVVAPEWLGEQFLLLPLDFDSYVRRDAIERAELVVDDVEQFEYYRSLGHFLRWPHPRGAVGDFRTSAHLGERVACVNLGVGALDAAFAQAVVAEARRRSVGVHLQR